MSYKGYVSKHMSFASKTDAERVWRELGEQDWQLHQHRPLCQDTVTIRWSVSSEGEAAWHDAELERFASELRTAAEALSIPPAEIEAEFHYDDWECCDGWKAAYTLHGGHVRAEQRVARWEASKAPADLLALGFARENGSTGSKVAP